MAGRGVRQLRRAGLDVVTNVSESACGESIRGYRRVVAGKPGGLVIDQRPSGGTLLSRGGRVDLIVTRKGN